MLKLNINNLRSAFVAAAPLAASSNGIGQVLVFTEDFDDGDFSDWTFACERNNNPFGDECYPPEAVGGAVQLHAKGSCFSPPFDGIAATKTILLPNGPYYITYTVSHSTTLWGFCFWGTSGSSVIFVNGVPISGGGPSRS